MSNPIDRIPPEKRPQFGQPSRNPTGKGGGSPSFRASLRRLLEHDIELDLAVGSKEKAENLHKLFGMPKKVGWADIVMASHLKQAAQGDTSSAKIVMEYIDGKPTQLIGGDPDAPVKHEVSVNFVTPKND